MKWLGVTVRKQEKVMYDNDDSQQREPPLIERLRQSAEAMRGTSHGAVMMETIEALVLLRQCLPGQVAALFDVPPNVGAKAPT